MTFIEKLKKEKNAYPNNQRLPPDSLEVLRLSDAIEDINWRPLGILDFLQLSDPIEDINRRPLGAIFEPKCARDSMGYSAHAQTFLSAKELQLSFQSVSVKWTPCQHLRCV